MRSIRESKDLALKETAKLLEKSVGKLDSNLPIFVKGPLRIILLNKIADIWKDELGEVLHVEPIVRSLNDYAFNSWLFEFKLAEAINQINSLTTENTTTKTKLFHLN